MAKLTAWLEDGPITIELNRTREYFIGRGETCDVRLSKSSISRRHARVYFDGDRWMVEIASRFGQISVGARQLTSLDLTDSTQFTIDDYRFEFITEAPEQVVATPQAPQISQPTEPPPGSAEVHDEVEAEVIDSTMIAQVSQNVTLKMTGPENPNPVLMRLEGDEWVAGRGSEADIRIRDSKSSRLHFKISKVGGSYLVTDLGSSNGTRLNGGPIPANAGTPLQSGDVIQVGQTKFQFEVKDPRFEQMVRQVPAAMIPRAAQDPEVFHRTPALKQKGRLDRKQMGMRVAIGLLGLIIVWALFSGEEAEKTDLNSETPHKTSGKGEEQAVALTPEQKILLEDSYNLANNLYLQGKYEAAVIELKKIHQMAPSYKESQKMLALSEQAIEIKAQRDEIERRKQEETRTKDRADAMVIECEQRNKKVMTSAGIQACLSEVFEIDPENSSAKALMMRAEREDAAREQRQANQKAYRDRVERGQALFKNAQSAEDRKDWADAVSMYEKFIQGGFPDSQQNVTKARERVTQLQAEIKKEVTERVNKARDLHSQGDYKGASDQLMRAMKLEPSNRDARSLLDKVQGDLFKKIKNLYGDSILEENLGNIEAAKLKWKNIMEMDSPGGEYHTKAMQKLQRYGEIRRGGS